MRKKVSGMVNHCKFLNIGLNLCGIKNEGCSYMADPHSCQTYDENFDRSYMESYKKKSLTEITQLESQRVETEVESLAEFTDRIEGDLNGMGIKVKRGEIEDIEEEVKEVKCPKCGSMDYSYDGLFIRCNSCKYTEWAKEIDGKLENLHDKWKRNIEEEAPGWF